MNKYLTELQRVNLFLREKKVLITEVIVTNKKKLST